MKRVLAGSLFILILVLICGCSKRENEEPSKNEIDCLEQSDGNQTNNNVNTDKPSSEVVIINEEPKKEEIIINKKTVVIDPGHGARGNKEKEKQSPDSDVMKIKDPGGAEGVSTKVPEYEVNMKVSLKLKDLLEQNNINVIMTKTDNNTSPGNIERADIGNINNADLSIRIHCDSADNQSVQGVSMLVPDSVGDAKDISAISRKYGQIILNDLVTEVGMNNRGVNTRSDLTGFNWSKVPVVLVEMGFMSNPKEDNLLNDDTYENKLAKGLCDGIVKSLK